MAEICQQALNGSAGSNGTGLLEGTAVATTCAGEIVAAAGGGRVALYHLNATRLAYDGGQRLAGQQAGLTCDGSFMVLVGPPPPGGGGGERAGPVQVYAATGTSVASWFAPLGPPLPDPALFAALSCRGRMLMTAGPDGAVRMYQYNGARFAALPGNVGWTVPPCDPHGGPVNCTGRIAGIALSCAGTLAAVGVPGQRAVYLLDTGAGSATTRVYMGDAAGFGSAVALAGDWDGSLLAVGAPNATAVYVYAVASGGTKARAHDLIREDGQPGFGAAVGLGGNGARLLVGTWSDYVAPGNATLYVWNGPQNRYLPANDEVFGRADPDLGRAVAVAHSGREFVVAAGGASSRRIAEVASRDREGTMCPPCGAL